MVAADWRRQRLALDGMLSVFSALTLDGNRGNPRLPALACLPLFRFQGATGETSPKARSSSVFP